MKTHRSQAVAFLILLGATAAHAELADRALMRPDLIDPVQIRSAVTTKGFSPIGEPVRRGDFYELQAMDSRGMQVRIVVDALYGDIVSVVRRNGGVVPHVDSGPRIINVPLPAERPVETPSTKADDIGAKPGTTRRLPLRRTSAPVSDDVSTATAIAPSQTLPPTATTAQGPARAILSPPSRPTEGPSPVRPLPRWRETGDTRPVEIDAAGALPAPHPSTR